MDLFKEEINDILELGAYENLWLQEKMSFKMVSTLLNKAGVFVSDIVEREVSLESYEKIKKIFNDKGLNDVCSTFWWGENYPTSLKDASYPIYMFYSRGNLELLHAQRSVAVVGSRQASDMGLKRAEVLAKRLVDDGVLVVSGLAKGIDTVALSTAINRGGRVLAVIGTAISEYYPRDNKELQNKIAQEHLLVSQVPVLKYLSQGAWINRFFFPERNVTMSALSQATIIVEAGETSGTLVQARAAINQGRKLFILENCFHKGLKWPEKYVQRGAHRVSSYEQIREIMRW